MARRYSAEETLEYLLRSSEEEENDAPDEAVDDISEEEDCTEAEPDLESEEENSNEEGPVTYTSRNGRNTVVAHLLLHKHKGEHGQRRSSGIPLDQPGMRVHEWRTLGQHLNYFLQSPFKTFCWK